MRIRIITLLFGASLVTAAAAQDANESAPTAPTAEAASTMPATQPVATAPQAFDSAGISLAELKPDELKLRLAPLRVDELEAIRNELLANLREIASGLASQLMIRLRLENTPDKDPAALAVLDADLAQRFESKSDLVSRINIVLDAIKAKGGEIATDEAYVAAIEALRPDEPAKVEEPVEMTAEERTAAATRQRVAELIAVVRAEPPVHERATPWEVPVAELELELQPLTLEQIEERLQEWQEILQLAVRRRVRYDILLNNADKLAGAQEARAEAARLAGIPADEADDLSLEALKAELAEQSQAQQAIVRAIVTRMDAAIRMVQMRGGDAKKYVDYIASATGQKLNLYDPSVLYAQVRAWLFAPDGGVEIGLNILKFIGVFLAFWLLSIILGWIASAAVGRLPQTSSLLRPLLVISVRRITLFIGLITAISMLGVSVGPLLAMIGAAGLVIGLALQGTLSNFASGIMILINRPYDVGDVIQAGGVFGKVEAMNLVSTRVLTFDNQIMLVPNNEIWNGVITNVTGRNTRRVDLTFGIAYSDDVSRAMVILEETLKSHPKVLSDPPPMVRVSELGDNSVNLIARPWSRTADYWDVYWDLMRDVKLRFDAEGINIPFPQRDLHVPGPIEVVLGERRGGNGQSPPPPARRTASAGVANEPGPAEDGDERGDG